MVRRACPTGKHRYVDKIAAKLALATIQNRDDTRRSKQETRIYRCQLCFAYHLTSSPRRPKNG